MEDFYAVQRIALMMTMYCCGQVDGPGGEQFSFYPSWLSAHHNVKAMAGGYLIVIKPASGMTKVWVTEEGIDEIWDELCVRTRVQLRRQNYLPKDSQRKGSSIFQF